MISRRAMTGGLLLSTLALPAAVRAQGQQVQYRSLARFQIDHEYFNGGDKGAGFFEIVPTAQTAQFMQYAGLVARRRGAGLDIYVASDAYDRLRAGYTDYEAWLNSEAMNSLVFEVLGKDPLLFKVTERQPGFTSEEFRLRSDRLTDAGGTLQVIGTPRTGDGERDQFKFGHFELRFAAPGGPLAGLFSAQSPQVETRTYTLRLASTVIRREYNFLPKGQVKIDRDSILISNTSGSMVFDATLSERTRDLPDPSASELMTRIGPDAATIRAMWRDGGQIMLATLERPESLRAVDMVPLTLMYYDGSDWHKVALPAPSADSILVNNGDYHTASIYVYL